MVSIIRYFCMTTQDLIKKAQSYFPKLQVVEKSSSSFIKFIAAILFFNRGFMTQFLTTIGETIYIPSMAWLEGNLSVLIHEVIHLYDEKRVGFWYNLSYLFPQLLVVLTIPLFFFVHWYIMLPIAVFCLLPFPAYWRAYFERRAYLVQLYILINAYHIEEGLVVERLMPYFKNSSYYFMNIFAKDMSLAEAKTLLASDKKLEAMVNDFIASI